VHSPATFLLRANRFDFDKFVTAVNDLEQKLEKQLGQRQQYETSLQHLVSWLNEVESTLKDYTELGTLETKQDQLDHYSVNFFFFTFN
jgi:chaperonin cofactor prefoldin